MTLRARDALRWTKVPSGLENQLTIIQTSVAAAGESINAIVVPKKSGRLQDSFEWEIQGKRLRFRWTAPYAPYVDEGFPSTPGRFVDVIGKRIVNLARRDSGMHPGFKGHHFTDTFLSAIRVAAVEEISKRLDKVMGS